MKSIHTEKDREVSGAVVDLLGARKGWYQHSRQVEERDLSPFPGREPRMDLQPEASMPEAAWVLPGPVA